MYTAFALAAVVAAAVVGATPYVSLIAGYPGSSGTTNGYGSNARFADPVSMGGRGFLNPGTTLLISDRSTGIRYVDLANSNYVGTRYSTGYTNIGVSNPDAYGNVYFSDQTYNNFWKLTPSGTASVLTSPLRSYGVWVSEFDGFVYATDLNTCYIWKVNPSNGAKTAYAGTGSCGWTGPAYRTSTQVTNVLNMQMTPNNDMYFTMYTLYSAYKIDGNTGIATLIAGTYGNSGSTPGAAGTARFGVVYGIAVSCNGDYVYLGDWTNGVWQVYNNYASVLVPESNSDIDGYAPTAARSHYPWGMDATEAGKLYFEEWSGGFTVRLVSGLSHGGCSSNYCCGATYDECNHLASVCPAMASTVSSLNALCSGGYTDACAVASALSSIAAVCSQMSANCQALISHC